ncbi:MAG: 2-C-methyl-D-erythritol 4-phosphate cytidylyltransferase [Acidaminococcaceae bacterium]|nr:2-C-methyl-D-erythritol 4-phosphate cytidylyltransferase [Acidaminococcaceae bacterium]
MNQKLVVILAAAGLGKRLGLGKNKAFVFLNQAPIIVHNLHQLSRVTNLTKVIVVVGSAELEEAQSLLEQFQAEYFPTLPWQLCVGGRERQDSVGNALALLQTSDGFVAVHDGARPFATPEIFARVLAAAQKTGAAIATVAVKDTIKTINAEGMVVATPQRSLLQAVQTPQIFKIDLLKNAYAYIQKEKIQVTDDASAVELLGVSVLTAEGSYANIKITTPEDLVWSQALLANKGEGKMGNSIRVGSGFDVHKLVEGRKLILCGVDIPYTKGLLGHSDADVATHALMDALLGAAGLGDIGRHFPDTDPTFKDADSIELLQQVMGLLREQGWSVGNADVTIIAQAPKLAPYREAMYAVLARALSLDTEDALNVKATTTENLGFAGRGEGIAAQAIVTLVK